jgi:hypothetical protein
MKTKKQELIEIIELKLAGSGPPPTPGQIRWALVGDYFANLKGEPIPTAYGEFFVFHVTEFAGKRVDIGEAIKFGGA